MLYEKPYYLFKRILNGRYLHNRPVMTFNDGNFWLYFGTVTLLFTEQQNGIKIDFMELKISIFQILDRLIRQ